MPSYWHVLTCHCLCSIKQLVILKLDYFNRSGKSVWKFYSVLFHLHGCLDSSWNNKTCFVTHGKGNHLLKWLLQNIFNSIYFPADSKFAFLYWCVCACLCGRGCLCRQIHMLIRSCMFVPWWIIFLLLSSPLSIP